MKKRHVWTVAMLLLVACIGVDVHAQCVMCKAVAEESAGAGGAGRGLNTAILYLMAVPYVLLGILGGVFFWKRRKS